MDTHQRKSLSKDMKREGEKFGTALRKTRQELKVQSSKMLLYLLGICIHLFIIYKLYSGHVPMVHLMDKPTLFNRLRAKLPGLPHQSWDMKMRNIFQDRLLVPTGNFLHQVDLSLIAGISGLFLYIGFFLHLLMGHRHLKLILRITTIGIVTSLISSIIGAGMIFFSHDLLLKNHKLYPICILLLNFCLTLGLSFGLGLLDHLKFGRWMHRMKGQFKSGHMGTLVKPMHMTG